MIKAHIDIEKHYKEPKIVVEGKTTTVTNEALGFMSSVLSLVIKNQYKTKKDALKFVDDVLKDFKKYMDDQICFDENLK